jgi:hypothetical protein
MLTGTFFLRRSQHNVQASHFLQEQLDTLRTLPFSELVNRTDGNLLGVSLDRGLWVVADSSGNNVLAITTAAAPLVTETGLAVLPIDYQDDFTATIKVRASGSSPVGWGTGFAFRYRDAENHYRFRISAGGIALDEVYQGTVTTLWSQSETYNTGTWYELEVIANQEQLTLKRDGLTLTTFDTVRFTIGDIALISINDALADFDDITIVGPSTTTFDFESETPGEFPPSWERLNFLDLPSGTATLTITNYLGQTSIKQATVDISWNDSASTRTMTGSTLISQ